jgi:2',3'-cyclic-nucleotide 2'-phosphodiesterase (5'-nucleotidase family)
MKKIIGLLVAVIMLLGTFGAWAIPARDEDDFELPESMIFFTNDVHCGIEDGWGYAGVAGTRELVEELGINTLLVDAGDHVQGGPIGTLSRGQYIIDIMNMAGYDLAIPGNHEFDYGMDQFFNLVDSADYPYISSNFMHYENGAAIEPVFDAYKIFELGDKSVAFVGVTTPEAITKSTPTYFQDEEGNYIYGFCQDATGDALVEAVQDAVDEVIGLGADLVVIIGHCGIDEQSSPWMSTELISRLHGIDAFIDGHSHSVINETVEDADGNPVLLAQTGTKLANLGMLSIYADGSIRMDVQAADDESTFIIPDPDVEEFIENIKAEYEELLHTVVAYTPHVLAVNDPATGNRMVRSRETNLGDLCADAYRELFGADIAFVNGGGVRATINPGEITFENIINVHPFGNEACLVEVTGQQILDALEMGARMVPAENGGFLQVAGLTYEIHTSLEPNVVVGDDKMWLGPAGIPYRVQNVQVMDRETGEYQPLDLERVYTLASHNYMLLNQGDGFAMFGRNNVNILQEDVMIDNAVLINYIQSMPGGEVDGVEYEHIVQGYEDPYGEGRIVIIDYEQSDTLGDVNGDGVIDMADALLVMRHTMGVDEIAEPNLPFADVNGDGVVDMADALLITRYVMGLIPEL